MVERRRFSRLVCSAPVQLRSVLEPQDPFAGSLSKDLSVSGIRMRVFSFFSVESRLVLLLSLPHSLKPIRAIARVVWTQEPGLAEACDCGLQFIEVAPEDREAIAQYIEQGITA
ncbi:MAG: PilZ domain-containing protein [Candidatus Omnitrophica bacterium]|nr:PilZ domain-containing protein [Candidatus Omnitrophota bacterium]